MKSVADHYLPNASRSPSPCRLSPSRSATPWGVFSPRTCARS